MPFARPPESQQRGTTVNWIGASEGFYLGRVGVASLPRVLSLVPGSSPFFANRTRYRILHRLNP